VWQLKKQGGFMAQSFPETAHNKTNMKKYRENYDHIFNKKEKSICEYDELLNKKETEKQDVTSTVTESVK